ncbi:MAG: class IV adenylate cyclase [Promethearchaeota archaeon]
MKEIEIKLKFNNKDEVVEAIKALGAEKKEEFSLRDRYFGLGHSDMSNTNSLVRIRTKNNNSELTYKGDMKDNNGIWSRTELNVNISDPEIMEKILLNLTFNKIKENSSEREIWMLGDTELAFINFTIPDELKILEIEGQEEKINEIVEKLGNMVSKIGEEAFYKFDKKNG